MLLDFRRFVRSHLLVTKSVILDNLDVVIQVDRGHMFVECLLRVIVPNDDCEGGMFVDTIFQRSDEELGFGEVVLCILELVDAADQNRIIKAEIFSDNGAQLIGACLKCNVSNMVLKRRKDR